MDQNRLQTYASLAEVISAVAIIISLLYVVIHFERGREANRVLIESPGMAEIVVAAGTAPDRMPAPDRLRYLAYQHDFFDTWEIAWYYHTDGILDTETWLDWDEWFTRQARAAPAFAWTDNRQNFTGLDFRDHVDAVLAR
jgi:hypothetical protein